MSTQGPVPGDAPLMLAWTTYKGSSGFANSRKWALHDEHVDGSLWAAFVAGWQAAGADVWSERGQELGDSTGSANGAVPARKSASELPAAVESPSSREAELHALAEGLAECPKNVVREDYAFGRPITPLEINEVARYALRLERERQQFLKAWNVALVRNEQHEKEIQSLRWQLATFERETRERIETLKKVEEELDDLRAEHQSCLDGDTAWTERWKAKAEQAEAALAAERENSALQLAACDVAALSNTRDSYAKVEIGRKNPAWSQAYDTVRKAVSREMQHREELQGLRDGLATLPIVHSSEIADDPAEFHGTWVKLDSIAALLEPKA